MKHLLAALLFALPGAPAFAQAPALPPLHAQGPQIVDAAGRAVRLRGVNVGGWLLQESYMLRTDSLGSQGRIKRALLRTLPEAAVEQFYADYRASYVTQADINFLADQGFNCVRVPFHYDLLLTSAQRHARNQALATGNVAAYVQALAGYYDRNELFTSPDQAPGFALLDDVIQWCAARNMYVVLDLHAALVVPGTVPAADYDLGRNGQAYFDIYAEKTEGLQAPDPNAGGACRNDGVDLSANPAGPGFVVNHTAAGEWLSYAVSIAKPGLYAVRLRAANPTPRPVRLALTLDGAPLGTFELSGNVPATDWPLRPAAPGPLGLPAGPHTLRLTVNDAGPVLGSLSFEAAH
ncbi:cellulase family glycosylhydrolase [Hymenobacter caeli]|uniref:CBM6 domain-containing protein n=1 Tax=Hymenobacter caeli TaxID=2735894 RepID=A0ABX2FP58_9BACT|nr:cellulase family glycosylhydrolase [Hymenobacter caeli]NRT18321.1 hypothetical protein [Hymenobacter caeli]